MKVICYGDSNTYGYDPRSYLGSRYSSDSRWVDILAELTGWNVKNDGVNGRMIPRGAVSLPADTDLLIIMLGTNNLLQGSGPCTVTERMAAFLKELPLAKDKVLLLAPPPLKRGEWVREEGLIENSRRLADHYASLAKQLGIRFADAGKWEIDLAFDGVHFSEEGHKRFAQKLYAMLMTTWADFP